jgi:hypothetical protein
MRRSLLAGQRTPAGLQTDEIEIAHAISLSSEAATSIALPREICFPRDYVGEAYRQEAAKLMSLWIAGGGSSASP